MNSLTAFSNNGIEILIDEKGECYYTCLAYSKIANKTVRAIQLRLEGAKHDLIKTAEIQTAGGLQGAKLITESLIVEWLPKDNPALTTELLKLGVRAFTHKLAGYEIKSTAVVPMTPAEMLLAQAQMMVDLERRQRETEQALVLQQAKNQELTERLEMVEHEQDRYCSPSGHKYTILGFARKHGLEISRSRSSVLGRKASAICREQGINIERINDPHYGKVGLYPETILIAIFGD